jgi:small-conductance mechanosensitive channel
VGNVWHFRLIELEGSPITVGTLIVFILLIVLGFFASRIVSRRSVAIVSRRMKLTEGGAAALQTVLFYALISVVVLFALHIVNIPLTVFAVLGGALAIGFGFGSQNIVNNFISGLIILVEQPIRVGDLVQVGDVYGVVRSIGARSTRVVTGDNVEILIPNSSFLENNVTNLTLSDDRIRAKVLVGVAYGSPVREVERLLMEAARSHDRVLDDPPPRVLFSDFGDNSLLFTLYFHVLARRLVDRLQIESDLRFAIDDLFRNADIVIAYPQRDVHLDSLKPLEVRVLGDRAPDHAG